MSTATLTQQPENFTDLFRDYYPLVKSLVFNYGIFQSDVEDVAMSILVKFYEHDVLSDYDPERAVSFRNFLASFVLTYLQHYRKRQTVYGARTQRDGLLTADKDLAQPAALLEGYEGLALWDTHRQITAHLDAVPRKGREQVDITALFRRVVDQVFLDGRITAVRLAEEFEVSENTITKWLRRLRVEVARAVGVS